MNNFCDKCGKPLSSKPKDKELIDFMDWVKRYDFEGDPNKMSAAELLDKYKTHRLHNGE